MANNIVAQHMGGSACDIQIDQENGTLTKRISTCKQGIENGHDKLLFEALHMRRNQALGFYPVIHSIEYVGGALSVTMDYLYGGVTLADYLLRSDISKHGIDQNMRFVLEKLFSDFFIAKTEQPDPNYIRSCYLDRAKRRILDSLRLITEGGLGWHRYQQAILSGNHINGSWYPSIFDYLDVLYNDACLRQKLMIKNTCESHHDLTSGNILIGFSDAGDTINVLKLIDPRGELETGADVRHSMYDMGKLLMGIDTFYLFRVPYHGGEKAFTLENGFRLTFHHNSPLVKNSIAALECTFDILDSLCGKSGEDITIARLRHLFSWAFMYHADIPCRIIDDADEDMALCFHLRGMMLLRQFMDSAYGCDPLRKINDNAPVDLWGADD